MEKKVGNSATFFSRFLLHDIRAFYKCRSLVEKSGSFSDSVHTRVSFYCLLSHMKVAEVEVEASDVCQAKDPF